jgi:glucokinase
MLATRMSDSSRTPVVGVDLGGTSVKAALVSHDLEMMGRGQVPTDLRSQRTLLELLTRLVEQVRGERDIAAVGFGLPSQIDQRHGRVLDSVNIPLADLDFVREMERRLGVPVAVDNDANVACLAETRIGAARGSADVVMLTLGTGVGGGLVLDGRLYRGAIGTGAELGHVTVDEDGPPCQGNCHNRGCLDVMCSATGIMRHANAIADESPNGSLDRERDRGEDLDARFVIERAQAGDAEAVEALRRAGRYLGVGLASFVNIFNPEVIVIGGGASAAGELLFAPAREEMFKRALSATVIGVRVIVAELGNDAGVLGAGALALDMVDSNDPG